MITHTDNTIFAIILTASVFTFGFSVARLVRAIRLGKPDLRLRDSLMKRFATMLGYAFGQKRVLDDIFGTENRVEELVWAMNTTNSQVPNYSTNHEYVLVYAKDRPTVEQDRTMFREPKPGYER